MKKSARKIKRAYPAFKKPPKDVSTMDTSKVTRVEVIDHTKDLEQGGGRVYTLTHPEEGVTVEIPIRDIFLKETNTYLKVKIVEQVTKRELPLDYIYEPLESRLSKYRPELGG